jgi:hypothetical protein
VAAVPVVVTGYNVAAAANAIVAAVGEKPTSSTSQSHENRMRQETPLHSGAESRVSIVVQVA